MPKSTFNNKYRSNDHEYWMNRRNSFITYITSRWHLVDNTGKRVPKTQDVGKDFKDFLDEMDLDEDGDPLHLDDKDVKAYMTAFFNKARNEPLDFLSLEAFVRSWKAGRGDLAVTYNRNVSRNLLRNITNKAHAIVTAYVDERTSVSYDSVNKLTSAEYRQVKFIADFFGWNDILDGYRVGRLDAVYKFPGAKRRTAGLNPKISKPIVESVIKKEVDATILDELKLLDGLKGMSMKRYVRVTNRVIVDGSNKVAGDIEHSDDEDEGDGDGEEDGTEDGVVRSIEGRIYMHMPIRSKKGKECMP